MDGNDQPDDIRTLEDIDPAERQRREMQRRRQEENRRAEEEREEHQAQLRAVADERQLKLMEIMDGLKEPEQRAIRLQAFVVAMNAGLLSAGASHGQTILDDLTLRMARYAVKGEA